MRTASRLLLAVTTVALAALLLRSAADDKEDRLWQHRNLGKALYENPSMKAEAVDELKKALDLAPGSLRDRLNYGLALLRADRTKEGIAELEMVQKQDPSIPHTWFNLGMAYKKEHRYEDAIKQFEGMAQRVRDEAVTRYQLGLLSNLLGNEEKALHYFRESLRLNPNLVAPRYQIYNIHRLAGRDAEAAREMEAFQKAKETQKALDESEDMEWSFYSELYDPIEARSLEEVSAPKGVELEDRRLEGVADPLTAGLAVLDVEGDEKPDLLVFSSKGILLYRAGVERFRQTGLEVAGHVVSVVPGDADNDGLADLCVLSDSGAVLFHNSKAKFEKQADLAPGRFEAAVWLDYDHDYDLDLFLLGAKSVLLRNEGAAGFANRTSDFPFVPGHATGGTTLRVIPDSKATDLALVYRDRPAVLYLDRTRGHYEVTTLDALPAGSVSLASYDVDNNSWPDLAAASPTGLHLLLNRNGRLEPKPLPSGASGRFLFADTESRGAGDIVTGGGILRNLGRGAFSSPVKPARFPAASACAEADFDRDCRTDLASVAADGTIHLLLNRTAAKHQWFQVALSGVKNAKLAPGSEVEVKAGSLYQKKVYQGVPLTFGLRSYKEIDTVRITWPNGLIQNETRQAANQLARYKEAPKLSGSCPMIFTYNGRRFEFLTDALGVAPLGASSGDGQVFAVDHDEYVQIPASALAARDGRLDLRITEELAEVSYLDQVRLIAVDYPAGVEIFSNDK